MPLDDQGEARTTTCKARKSYREIAISIGISHAASSFSLRWTGTAVQMRARRTLT